MVAAGREVVVMASGAAWTVSWALPAKVPTAAVMVAVPGFCPVATPAFTVATAALEEVHVAEPVTLAVELSE